MRRDFFGHASRIRASRRFNRLGEALALHRGWRLRGSATVRSWLRSPSHRAVVLSTGYRYIGVGVARGRFGRAPSTISVLQVGG